MIATNLIELSLCQCSELQKQLELSRDNLQAKLQMVTILKHCSTCAIVVVTTSLAVLVVSHGFALLVAMPGITLMNLHSKRKLTNATAQLDAAAKGTYILNKDLETTSRLVARLNDEMEHIKKMVKFWLERKEDKIQADGEVRVLKKNQCNFSDQLDELEEHLYLCFMTINRARDLVLNQITASA
ncbi:putative transmembrane protein [Trifolium repens]|nr:putative transmembrane protein [Trifolium repens]